MARSDGDARARWASASALILGHSEYADHTLAEV